MEDKSHISHVCMSLFCHHRTILVACLLRCSGRGFGWGRYSCSKRFDVATGPCVGHSDDDDDDDDRFLDDFSGHGSLSKSFGDVTMTSHRHLATGMINQSAT